MCINFVKICDVHNVIFLVMKNRELSLLVEMLEVLESTDLKQTVMHRRVRTTHYCKLLFFSDSAYTHINLKKKPLRILVHYFLKKKILYWWLNLYFQFLLKSDFLLPGRIGVPCWLLSIRKRLSSKSADLYSQVCVPVWFKWSWQPGTNLIEDWLLRRVHSIKWSEDVSCGSDERWGRRITLLPGFSEWSGGSFRLLHIWYPQDIR